MVSGWDDGLAASSKPCSNPTSRTQSQNHRVSESFELTIEPYNCGTQLPRPTDTQHLGPTDYPSWAPSRRHDLTSSHESLKEKDSSDTSCGLHPHALPPSPKNQSERLLVKLLMR